MGWLFFWCLALVGCALPVGEDFVVENTNLLVIAGYDLQDYVPAPEAGAKPVTVNRGDVDIEVVWKEALEGGESRVITENLTRFVGGKQYQADITLRTKNRWTFDPEVNFQYADELVTVQPEPDGDRLVRALTTVTYRETEDN
jgi:hypothetical protein